MNNLHYSKKNIYAVIVTYNQDNILLSELIANLIDCGIFIVVVKNSDHKIQFDMNHVYEIQNNKNIGLARALNQGIEYCLEAKPDMILLFDQDSRINSNQIGQLIDLASEFFKTTPNIAAIGPSFIELNTNKIHGFANLKFLKVTSKRSEHKYNDALYLITSGTVLNPESLRKIGLMDETLFIDYIDTEWGLRARSLGYRLVGVNDIIMKHVVGDNSVKFLFWAVPIHSKIRLYYQTRNSIYLYKKSHILLRWKFADFIYFLKRSTMYIFIDLRNISIIINAIYDGIKLK